MNEHEERFADSGLPITRPLTRRAALKVGALGVLGAAAAAYLPGRARGGTIVPAPCHAGQGFVCGRTTAVKCGGPTSGCSCAFQYTGGKITQVKSYCVNFTSCCSSLGTCPNGQVDCPPGTVCSATTCCPTPVCLPACGSTVTPGTSCQGPGGFICGLDNCGTGFSDCCNGCPGQYGIGCDCFTTTEDTGVCTANVFCGQTATCSASSDCPAGWFCITDNGCTGCAGGSGVCAPPCNSGGAGVKAPAGRGMTASGKVY